MKKWRLSFSKRKKISFFFLFLRILEELELRTMPCQLSGQFEYPCLCHGFHSSSQFLINPGNETTEKWICIFCMQAHYCCYYRPFCVSLYQQNDGLFTRQNLSGEPHLHCLRSTGWSIGKVGNLCIACEIWYNKNLLPFTAMPYNKTVCLS